MEPVSPELALIDPELRRSDLSRAAVEPLAVLRLQAQRVAPVVRRPAHPVPASVPSAFAAGRPATVAVAAPHTEVPRAARPAWVRRAVQVVPLAGLMAAGILVTDVAFRSRTAEQPVPLTGSTLANEKPQPQPLALDEQGVVERKILALVIQTPSRLPAALIDKRTGLAKNNLQAVCRRASAGGYLCVVRPASHKPGEGLYVRYRVGADGRTSFTWSSYRPG
jgi:hypothetical protein